MLKIEKAGTDRDMLTGKEEVEGCYVVLDDGARGFLSWKSLKNLVVMKSMMHNGNQEFAPSNKQLN